MHLDTQTYLYSTQTHLTLCHTVLNIFRPILGGMNFCIQVRRYQIESVL